MTSTTKTRKPAPKPEPLPTHAQGLELFQQVKRTLQLAGWEQLRVDTLVAPDQTPGDRYRLTVRHHFDHGVWELYYETDRYWASDLPPLRVCREIRLDRPLPSVERVINELFGPEVRRYFPAGNDD
jgi:hypothetical protein